jgi:hypothetical protein
MKKFLEFLNEDNKWGPFKALTYKIELDILFEGFERTKLSFTLLFPHYDEISDNYIKENVDKRLKVFNNVVSYDIVKAEMVEGKERILPMH